MFILCLKVLIYSLSYDHEFNMNFVPLVIFLPSCKAKGLGKLVSLMQFSNTTTMQALG